MGHLSKEGVHNMFAHGFMSFAAVCVTVACLVIIGSFSLIIYNLSIFVSDLEQKNRILVFVDETYDTAEAKSVGSRINLIDNVREAVFMSRDEAGKRFIEQQGGGEAYQGIDASTFRDRFVVTLEDNSKMKETVEQIPLDRILLETDCPYMAPEPFRGRRNDSTLIKYVAETIASLRGMSAEEVIRITTENARRFYGLQKEVK